jgi:hypothetical protein
MKILVATGSAVLRVDPDEGTVMEAAGLGDDLPTCIAADPWVVGRAWCGTSEGGVFGCEACHHADGDLRPLLARLAESWRG